MEIYQWKILKIFKMLLLLIIMVIYAKSFSLLKKIVIIKYLVLQTPIESDTKAYSKFKKSIPKLIDLINKQNLNEYIKMVVNFSFEANKYFNDSEPWLFKKKIQIE